MNGIESITAMVIGIVCVIMILSSAFILFFVIALGKSARMADDAMETEFIKMVRNK